jgi:hypothetical protein
MFHTHSELALIFGHAARLGAFLQLMWQQKTKFDFDHFGQKWSNIKNGLESQV